MVFDTELACETFVGTCSNPDGGVVVPNDCEGGPDGEALYVTTKINRKNSGVDYHQNSRQAIRERWKIVLPHAGNWPRSKLDRFYVQSFDRAANWVPRRQRKDRKPQKVA